jgi:hypothetical protein
MDALVGIYTITLIICIGITLYKLYNVLSEGKLYDFKLSIILFISFIISWFVSFTITMLKYKEMFYSSMFYMLIIFFGLNTLFMIIEIFLGLASEVTKRERPDTRTKYGYT